MDNPLSNFKIQYWYHAVMVLSGFMLVYSLSIPLVGIDNSIVQKISLGTFFIGLGEWINHPLQTKLYPPSFHMPTGGTTTGYPRNNQFTGIIFILLGIGFIIWGLIPC